MMDTRSLVVYVSMTCAALAGAGCASRPMSFRLTAPGLLLPPDVKDATVSLATLRLPPVSRKVVCAASAHGLLVQRGNRIVVTSAAMNATPAAELFAWTVALEKQGCIAPNTAFRVAEDIIDALPLDLAKRRQLLEGRVDLRAVNSLNVLSPVLKPGTTGPLVSDVTSVTPGAGGAGIEVAVKANPGVIGYEIDWYDVQPKEGGAGYRVVPRSAELHVGGDVQHPAVPSTPRFQFGADASWYELNMMTRVSSNDFDFVLFSAKTSAELQESVASFQRDATAFLKTADPSTYTVLPHGTGINAFMRVKINGVAFDMARGSTVSQAITMAKGDPRAVLARLKVGKLHAGRLFPVVWEAGVDRILSLPLEGGEEIAW